MHARFWINLKNWSRCGEIWSSTAGKPRAMSRFATGYSAFKPKSLDSIINVEALRHCEREELTDAWNEHHLGRGHISAVIDFKSFQAFEQRSRECPMFVLPIRRGSGFVSMLFQAKPPYMLFTGLEDYKAHRSEASPYFTVTHYLEFAESKGLVLVRGDIVLSSKLSDEEAKTLLALAHSMYLDYKRYQLVQQFNKNSQEFDFQDVLREFGRP